MATFVEHRDEAEGAGAGSCGREEPSMGQVHVPYPTAVDAKDRRQPHGPFTAKTGTGARVRSSRATEPTLPIGASSAPRIPTTTRVASLDLAHAVISRAGSPIATSVRSRPHTLCDCPSSTSHRAMRRGSAFGAGSCSDVRLLRSPASRCRALRITRSYAPTAGDNTCRTVIGTS